MFCLAIRGLKSPPAESPDRVSTRVLMWSTLHLLKRAQALAENGLPSTRRYNVLQIGRTVNNYKE